MDYLMVNVQPIKRGGWGKICRVRGKAQKCNKVPCFMVFNGDGKPKRSRLDSICCENHLIKAIKNAFKENQESSLLIK